MHFARYIDYWARHRAERLALQGPGATLTWRELGIAASHFAAQLNEAGVVAGDRVGILLPNRLEWCVAFAGMQLVGAMCVPLNPLFGLKELRDIAGRSDCRLVVSSDELMSRLTDKGPAEKRDMVSLFRTASAEVLATIELFPAEPKAAPSLAHDEDAPAVICYTSGTTGLPKGAIHTHKSISAMTTGLTRGYAMTSDEIFLLCAPLSFTGGVICHLGVSLALGACLILEPGYDPLRALDLIQKQRVTCFGGAAIFWQRLANVEGFDQANLESLRHGFTGGAPVPPDLLRLFLDKGVLIRQAYGCTENGGGATLPTEEQARLRPEACGFPMIGIELELRDDDDQRVAPGEIGEIVMRGPQLMAGYWNEPELTAQAMAGGWYHSGDLGQLNEFGELLVVDRKKNMVISGGVNIYPAEVEAVLAAIPGVSEAAAFGVPSDVWGEELVAILVTTEPLDIAATTADLKAILGNYKTPKRFAVRGAPLFRTSTGKVERSALRRLFDESVCVQVGGTAA